MPASSDRITFEGARTTVRTRDMLLQARAIFYKKTGHLPPKISQGGYNKGGVSASAGTHDRDAMDFATSGWSSRLQKEWENALWQVGFAGWHRPYVYRLWPEHTHAIPKNGDLSQGAKNQVYAFNWRRDGLVSNRPYPRIGKYAYMTWELYKENHKARTYWKVDGKKVKALSSVSVYWINKARANSKRSRHVWIVQVWLKRTKHYKGALDGRWSEDVQSALDSFRKSLGWKGNDIRGPIGLNSLQWLRMKANSTRMIREGM